MGSYYSKMRNGLHVLADIIAATGLKVLAGGAEIAGDSSVTGDLAVTGDLTFTGNVGVMGNVTITGNVSAPGVEKLVELGEITFEATSGEAVTLYTLPAGVTLTQVICKVTAAFDAGDSNVLILGTTDNDDAFMASGTIDEAALGAYFASVFETGGAGGTAIKAKYTQAGTAATAGAATFYGKITQLPA